MGAELAIIILYPTNASGIIVLLKTFSKYRKLNTKTKKFRVRSFNIFVEHGIINNY